MAVVGRVEVIFHLQPNPTHAQMELRTLAHSLCGPIPNGPWTASSPRTGGWGPLKYSICCVSKTGRPINCLHTYQFSLIVLTLDHFPQAFSVSQINPEEVLKGWEWEKAENGIQILLSIKMDIHISENRYFLVK